MKTHLSNVTVDELARMLNGFKYCKYGISINYLTRFEGEYLIYELL